MEPRFIVQTTVSEELIRMMSRQACANLRTRLIRIIFVVVGAHELYLLLPQLIDLIALYTASGSPVPSSILPNALLCLLLLFAIIYGLFLIPLRVRRSFRKANKAQMGCVIVHTFYDDHCTCEYTGSSSTMQYELIESMQECKDAFIMHRTVAGSNVFLPKNAFTLGTPDAFRSFLEKEKGKPFKTVR